MKKIIVIGGVMVVIGLACCAADAVGNWKRGNSLMIGKTHCYLLKTPYALGDKLIYKGYERRVIGIELTKGETRYTLVGNGEGLSVPASNIQ